MGRPVRGDKAGCIKKMTTFIKSERVTKDEIFEATKIYVFEKKRDDYKAMTCADYFINKDGISMSNNLKVGDKVLIDFEGLYKLDGSNYDKMTKSSWAYPVEMRNDASKYIGKPLTIIRLNNLRRGYSGVILKEHYVNHYTWELEGLIKYKVPIKERIKTLVI